jgi:hypothetical protein
MTDLHKPYRLSRSLHWMADEIEDALLMATNPANDSATTAAHVRTARRAIKALDKLCRSRPYSSLTALWPANTHTLGIFLSHPTPLEVPSPRG